jgi:cytochrome c
MDGFEINKILGALLGTVLFIHSANIVAGAVFAPHVPATPGYEIAVPDAPAPGAMPAAVEPTEPIEVRLAKADVKRGESAARKCVACHTFEKGEANKVGPNLWGSVGGPRAHHDQFSYSAAMRQMGGTWDFEALDRYLTNPRAEVKGTIMVFAGVPRATERADIIAYLNSMSDKPLPLPEPKSETTQ